MQKIFPLILPKMAQAMREKGMTVINHGVIVEPLNYPTNIPSQDAVELGKHMAADIVVIGSATAEKTTNLMDGNVKSFKGTLTAKAYRTETGKEIASAARTAVSASEDDESGGREALFNAGLLVGQEMILQLWRSFPGFKGNSSFSTWMYRVALNTAISFLKRDKSKLKKVSSEGLDNFKMEPFDPVMEERIEWLYKSIQELSVVEKGIILLYLEGKSHQEISGITGFSATNVGTRISRIKEKLKRQISN